MERTYPRIRLQAVGWKSMVFLAVGLFGLGWLLVTPQGLLGHADAVGYAVCHRIDLRSFHLGDRQLPMCARCTGMYLGAVLGLVYQAFLGRRRGGAPSWLVIIPLGFFVAAFAFDGLNSFISLFPLPHFYDPNNTLRLLTGLGMGLVIALSLYPAFNQTVWQDWDSRPALSGVLPFLGLLAATGVLAAAVLSGNPLLLYPLALLSSAGVLLLLSMIYAMIWLIVLRKENLCLRLSQLWLPLAGGLGMALAQIAFLDLVRFLLTGTWDGFHLG
jgi:uncharacterized membrane protein